MEQDLESGADALMNLVQIIAICMAKECRRFLDAWDNTTSRVAYLTGVRVGANSAGLYSISIRAIFTYGCTTREG